MAPSRITNRKLIANYLRQKRSVSEGFYEVLEFKRTELSRETIRSYSLAAKNFVRIIGNAQLDELTQRHSDLFLATRSREVRPRSVNVDIRSLRSLFAVLTRWQYLSENIFADVKLLRIPESTSEYFTPEQFNILLSHIPPSTFKSLIVFSFLVGTRLGETLNLEWQNVDFIGKVIHIKNSEAFRTKSGRNRSVPMHDALFSLLQSMNVGYKSRYVFCKPNGDRYKRDSISRRFKRLLRRYGFSESLHAHSLRHSFASNLVQQGVPIYDVAHLLGHASVVTTQRYAHLFPETRHESVNKIKINYYPEAIMQNGLQGGHNV